MNIYITDDSFKICAQNLDTVKLKQQVKHLAQIFSNVLRSTNDYCFLFENTEKNKDYPEGLLTSNLENHNSTIWAKKSPIHLRFIASYLLCCVEAIRYRHYFAISSKADRIYRIAKVFNQRIDAVIPGRLGNLCGLKGDLYRNTPSYLENEPDTIKAYQSYLTRQWKSIILRQFQYSDAHNKYLITKDIENKPRKPSFLKWDSNNLKCIPNFASKELNDYIEELTNANKQSTATG